MWVVCVLFSKHHPCQNKIKMTGGQNKNKIEISTEKEREKLMKKGFVMKKKRGRKGQQGKTLDKKNVRKQKKGSGNKSTCG